MFVRVIQHAHAFVSSSTKLIFVCLKCNKMYFTWLIKYFSFSFPLKDYFYLFSFLMFKCSEQWFRHFLNFTAAYLMYDYYHIWSTYLHVKIFGWLIGLRASPDKLDEIAWVSRLPTRQSLFRFHLCPFPQKRLIPRLLTWPLTWRWLVQFACEMHTPYLTILIWSYLEERSCLSKRIPGDVLVFASNNCKLGESIRWGRGKGGEW